MAHLLYRLGEAALKPRTAQGGKILPPLISFQQAMKLREEYYAADQPWPYEHLVPGAPQPPPGAEQYLKRKAQKEEKRQARIKEIQEAMAKMPSLIKQYREQRKFEWSQVSEIDKLTLPVSQIREKYMKKKLSKV